MIIQGLVLTFLAVIAGLVSVLIGLVGWIVLKLMKDELHLDIKINSGDKFNELQDPTTLERNQGSNHLFP